MPLKIEFDDLAPTAAVEIRITRPLPDYDLDEVEAATSRDVDPILASQGFKDLLDETRNLLERELSGGGLDIVQIIGAICHGNGVHHPGLWLVLRESGAEPGQPMSVAAREKVQAAAQAIRATLLGAD